MNAGERKVNAISMSVLISVFFFLLSFGFVRIGILFAITGVFEHPLYWGVFFLVAAFGAIAGGVFGVNRIVVTVSNLFKSKDT